MPDIPVCPECGVPRLVTAEHTWLSDGAIVQTRFWGHRMAFVETENLDPLFKGIEELVGMSIQDVLVRVSRRATLGYMLRLVTDEVRDMLFEGKVGSDLVIDSAFQLTRIMGYGDPTLVGCQLRAIPRRLRGRPLPLPLLRTDYRGRGCGRRRSFHRPHCRCHLPGDIAGHGRDIGCANRCIPSR